MSTLAYAYLTNARERSSRETESTGSGIKTYIDAFAALVPAEVLTLHALIISVATKTANEPIGGTTTTSTVTTILPAAATTLHIAFWGLVILSMALYAGPRYFAGKWDRFDWARITIAPLAFLGWTMLQRTTAFDAAFPFVPDVPRTVSALFLGAILGGVTAVLALKAGQTIPNPQGATMTDPVLPWSSSAKPAAAATETVAIFRVLETQGSPGSAATEPSVAAEDLLVFGKSDARLKPSALRVGLETVLGVDQRMRISDTDKLPWRMIAALQLVPTPPSTSRFIGTGWFIGPKTLLTAGHCVYSESDFGGWIHEIEVSAGRNGDKLPYGTVKATRFSALDGWKSSSNPDFDIGCIHLDQPIGEQVGYFKISSLSDSDLKDALLNVSGYPADRGGGKEQYFHANRVLHTAARRVYYDIDTYGGQSGSPVWFQATPEAAPAAIAVHAYGVGGTASNLGIEANSGPRLTPEVVETVRQWLAADST